MKGNLKVKFNEVLTKENVLAMSEFIALNEVKYLIKFMGTPTIKIFSDLMEDVNHKNVPSYVLTDSYDIIQQVALLLCENMGKTILDTHHIEKNGKRVTIQLQAEREIIKIVNYKTRHNKRDYSLDAMLENQVPYTTFDDELVEEDYSEVDKIIDSLELNETQRTALECRMNGMSYPEIARAIQRALSTTYECLQKIRIRYMSMCLISK